MYLLFFSVCIFHELGFLVCQRLPFNVVVAEFVDALDDTPPTFLDTIARAVCRSVVVIVRGEHRITNHDHSQCLGNK